MHRSNGRQASKPPLVESIHEHRLYPACLLACLPACLLGTYGAPVIPLDKVLADFFGGMTQDKFLRKVSAGEYDLPIVRMAPNSQKSPKGVALVHLAEFLDRRIAAAAQERDQLMRQATATLQTYRRTA